MAVAYHYIHGYYLGLPYPQSTFLCMPSDFGNDLFHIIRATATRDPYSYQWSVYFPFMYVSIFPLTFVHPYLAYGLTMVLFLGFMIHLIWTHLLGLREMERCTATFILTFLSYPVIFTMDRGNVEILVFACLYLFLGCYLRGALSYSVIFLACAGAMKLYPLVFAVLFLEKGKYRYLFATGLITMILTCGAAALYPGGMIHSFKSLGLILEHYRRLFIIGNQGLPYGSSYFGLLKILLRKIYPLYFNLEKVLPYYTVIALALFGALTAFIAFVEREFWKKVAVLTALMIVLPHVSGDYKLIHLFFPLAFFLNAERRTRLDIAYAVIFGLLLIPKAFFWIAHSTDVQLVPAGVVLTPILITVLVALIVCEGYRNKGRRQAEERVMGLNLCTSQRA